MQARKLSDKLSVSEQISPEDMADLAEQGFRSVLCNRPDDEAPGQPSFEEISQAAAEHGLAVRHVPIVSGQVSMLDIDDFAVATEELPTPILAYCRSGTRSSQLWALTQANQGRPLDEILPPAAEAGYDLRGMAPLLTSLISAAK